MYINGFALDAPKEQSRARYPFPFPWYG